MSDNLPVRVGTQDTLLAEQPKSLLDRIAEETARDQARVSSRYKPVMSLSDMVEREKNLSYLVDNIMREGIDYGWVPGTKPKENPKPGEYQPKPTLFKAGAERACAFFGYAPTFRQIEKIEEWTAETYGEMLFYFEYECSLSKDGALVGTGIGSGSTWESKYRYRNADRTCPTCGAGAIIRGKAEYGGGWLCFAKKGGCGAKFADLDPAITEQQTGKVANPDIADVVNTVQKMAQKRAYVAATLTATGLSGRFTQDMEDAPQSPPAEHQRNTPTEQKQAISRKADAAKFEADFRSATKFGRLNVFKKAKERFIAVLGPDKGEMRYYDHLNRVGAEKSTDVAEDADKAFAVIMAMFEDARKLEEGAAALSVPPAPEEWPEGRE